MKTEDKTNLDKLLGGMCGNSYLGDEELIQVQEFIDRLVAAETAACIALVEEAGRLRFWPTAAKDFARLLRERLPKAEPLPQAAPLPQA